MTAPIAIQARKLTAPVALGLALAIASCGSPAAPAPAPGAATVGLEVIAPPTIEPGQTVKLTARATKDDGSIEDVSSSVQWSVENSSIVQITGAGMAFGKTRGETVVSVSGDRARSPGARIHVLPNGTFGVRGVLSDSGVGVENAHITVISGIGTGLTMMTRFGGSFALYGVAGPVQIEVRKTGYSTILRNLDVGAHTTMDFVMEPERPRPDVTGTYALTISATQCAITNGVLPEEARRRVYTARVEQNDGRLAVTLSDADLIVTKGNGNRFFGFLDPDGSAVFYIGFGELYYGDYLGHFDIVERLGTTTFFASGTAVMAQRPDGLFGHLSGMVGTSSRTTAPFVPSNSECSAKAHGFDMVRR